MKRLEGQVAIVTGGEQLPPSRFWHMDAYEKRNGRWQVVWSQATEINKESGFSFYRREKR